MSLGGKIIALLPLLILCPESDNRGGEGLPPQNTLSNRGNTSFVSTDSYWDPVKIPIDFVYVLCILNNFYKLLFKVIHVSYV